MGMTTAERIKERREAIGLTQDELAKRIGFSDRSSVTKIEKSGDQVTLKTVEKMVAALSCSVQYLMGWENMPSKAVRIPVLGRVAAGIPIEAIEEIVGEEEITEVMSRQGEYFGLLIKGDSMEPRILDGDVVIVRKQSDADSGDLVIALINGEDGVCKRLMKYPESIALVSNNQKYAPLVFTLKEVEEKPVQIIGKVVELRGKY